MQRDPQLSQKELAERLCVTSRQVHNLVELGMPRRAERGKAYFRWPECFRWYVKHREELIAAKFERKAPKNDTFARKLEAETRLQEIELAKEEGQLVSIDYMERQVTGTLERVRAQLLNMPGKYAPALAGIQTIAEAQLRIEGMVGEVMGAMTEIGEDPELDAGDDDPTGEGGMAA